MYSTIKLQNAKILNDWKESEFCDARKAIMRDIRRVLVGGQSEILQ